MKDNTLKFFDTLIVRTPGLPLSSIDSNAIAELDLHTISKSNKFMNALFIANHIVHDLLVEWIKDIESLNKKDLNRLKKTIYNYWTRMHFNCVPFGMFSNISTATWSDNPTKVILGNTRNDVRLDMGVLSHLVNLMNEDPILKEFIPYYSNNTIYRTQHKLRYNESVHIDGKISYKLSAVDSNEAIDKIVAFTSKPKSIKEIVSFLDIKEYTYEEVKQFILSLVKEQLLVSSLNLNITGKDPLEVLLAELKSIEASNKDDVDLKSVLHSEIYYLEEIQRIIKLIKDSSSELRLHFQQLYDHLLLKLENVDKKKMIQVDGYREVEVATLNNSIKENLTYAVKFMSLFQQNDYLPYTENFKKEFSKRYESGIFPLMEVLDTESGISFGDFKYIDDNLFTSKLGFDNKPQVDHHINDNIRKFKIVLYKKWLKSLQENLSEIKFDKSDLADFEDNTDKLADSFQVIFNLDKDAAGEDKVALVTVGNSGAGNLIARFSHGDEKVNGVLQEIADYEASKYNHAVVAEIAHIPEYRIGNISLRDSVRKYEIPIITKSMVSSENQIPIDDLYVTVRNDRIVIFSKKLGKRVIPKLTNAHNYGKNTLPIYQFLSELSYQDIIPSLAIDTGIINYLSKKIPRISCENIIVSKATWLFQQEDLHPLLQKKTLTLNDVNEFTSEWGLPEYVEYYDNDKTLPVFWKNLLSVEAFLEKVKDKDGGIVVAEMLFNADANTISDSDGNSYFNQVISFCKNDQKDRRDWLGLQNLPARDVKRKFYPGEEWLYFNIYCGRKTYETLLKETIHPLTKKLISENKISKFFFLPYNDPDFHLRIRFQLNAQQDSIYDIITSDLLVSQSIGNIDKIRIDTYKRELERYGYESVSIAEELFFADCTYNLAVSTSDGYEYFYTPLYAIQQIETILDGFERDFSFKFKLIERIRNAYNSEFSMEKGNDLWIGVMDEINAQRNLIEDAISFVIPESSEKFIEKFKYENEQYKLRIRKIYSKNIEVLGNEDFLLDFLPSIIHLHLIRVFPDSPRQNELFVYNALYNYYRKMYFINKKNKSK